MKSTKIEWCDSTINPVVGCTYNCEYCYAKKLNNRFNWVKNFSSPEFFANKLNKLNNKSRKLIFVNSMSDIADWRKEWIDEIHNVLLTNPINHYLFLTKRVNVYSEGKMLPLLLYPCNWFGLTVTKKADLPKIKLLPHNNAFLSIEPLQEWLIFDEYMLDNIQWVIIGAETGNQKNKIIPKKEWITYIVLECAKYNIPIYMKNSLKGIVGEEHMLREFPVKLKGKGEKYSEN